MYNQTEAILAQYELEIKQVTKGRGTFICDTDKGRKLLSPFRGSPGRGACLREYLQKVSELGFEIEQIELNKNGEAVTVDEITGEGFIIKDKIEGMELGTSRFGEMLEAAELLAEYHRVAECVSQEECAEKVGSLGICQVTESRVRHGRELIKVRNYIRTRKKKSEFERLFMAHLPNMLQTAERSIEILKQEESKEPNYVICHGDCNQHNLLWSEKGWHMVNFENAVWSWPTWDLANYIRKMLEKNAWDVELGLELVKAYDRKRSFLTREGLQLYGLLLFPEKFWKITNHYMNSNKAWIPVRDIEKLEKVIAQEPKRLLFMEKLFSIVE